MSDICASSSHSDTADCEDSQLNLSNLLQSSGEEKSNALSVYCPRCPSLILRPGHGILVSDVRRSLPNMTNVRSGDPKSDITHYRYFWRVADIFTFENVGYTNTVDGRCKYLTCADCECGPLGIQLMKDDNTTDASAGDKKPQFSYVALARVSHR